MKRVRLVALVVALTAAGLLLASPAAEAHALLRSSEPSNGEILQKAPTQVLLTFTEPPDVGLSIVHVIDASGHDVEAGKPQGVPGNSLALRVRLGSLGNGVYTVSWRVISHADGHLTGGSFSFGIGVSTVPPPGSTPSTPRPSVESVAGKWLLYWGLALLIACAVVGIVALGGHLPARRALLAAGWGSAWVGLLLAFLAEAQTAGVSLARLFSSGRGQLLTWESIAVGATGALALVAIVRRSHGALALLGLGASGAMLAHAAAGHPGAAGSWRWFKVGTQWIHLMSVGVWVGGFVVLLLALRDDRMDRGHVAGRFSTTATVCLTLVAVTGTLRAVDEVGSFGRLFSTSFGEWLDVKVALFALLVALGALNRFRNVPRLATGRADHAPLRTAVRGEVVFASLILAATGVLTGLAPASTVAATSPAAAKSIVLHASDAATTVRATLTVTPGTVGPNRFAVELRDFDTGKPVLASGVALRFSLPSRVDIGTATLSLTRGAPGDWSGQGTALAIAGRWHVIVAVQETNTAFEIPFDVQTREPPENVSCVPGSGTQPTLCTVTLPDGSQVQSYLDPEHAGKSDVHVTYFNAAGNELPIASIAITGGPQGGTQTTLQSKRFSAGHFAADVTLTAGTWHFDVTATKQAGGTISVYFDIPVKP